MKKLAICLSFIFAASTVAFGQTDLRPLTSTEISEVSNLFDSIPAKSYGEFIAGTGTMNFEQKIYLLGLMGGEMLKYAYDGSQTWGNYKATYPAEMWAALQKVISENKSIPTSVDTGIHQLMALAAVDMGMEASIFTSRSAEGKHRCMAIVRSEDHGFVIMDFGSSYVTKTYDFDKARTILQRTTGKIFVYSYVGNPRTANTFLKVDTIEGRKIKEDSGWKDVVTTVSGNFGLTPKDLREKKEAKKNEVGMAGSANGAEAFVTYYPWTFLGLRLYRNAYVSNDWTYYGAIQSGNVIRPGISLDFVGKTWKVDMDVDYSYQTLDTGVRINRYQTLNVQADADKLFMLIDHRMGINLTGGFVGNGAFEDKFSYDNMYPTAESTVGFSFVCISRAIEMYGGPMIYFESVMGNFQELNPVITNSPAFNMGAKLRLDRKSTLLFDSMAGSNNRLSFFDEKLAYSFASSLVGSFGISTFCRIEQSNRKHYVPDALKFGGSVSAESTDDGSGKLALSLLYEREIMSWPDEKSTVNDNIKGKISYKF